MTIIDEGIMLSGNTKIWKRKERVRARDSLDLIRQARGSWPGAGTDQARKSAYALGRWLRRRGSEGDGDGDGDGDRDRRNVARTRGMAKGCYPR